MCRAIIWDMDGVLVDTAPYHYRAWRRLCQERGRDLSEQEFYRSFGERNDGIVPRLFGDMLPEEVTSLAERKEEYYRQEVRGNVRPNSGSLSLLRILRQKGFPMAIASSAPLENIELILDALGIKGDFQCIVSGRDVKAGKPDPACFVLAAERLGLRPEDCLVIEDAPGGVRAAKRAGMKCIALTSSHPASHLQEADLIVDDLGKLSLEEIQQFWELTEPGPPDTLPGRPRKSRIPASGD